MAVSYVPSATCRQLRPDGGTGTNCSGTGCRRNQGPETHAHLCSFAAYEFKTTCGSTCPIPPYTEAAYPVIQPLTTPLACPSTPHNKSICASKTTKRGTAQQAPEKRHKAHDTILFAAGVHYKTYNGQHARSRKHSVAIERKPRYASNSLSPGHACELFSDIIAWQLGVLK